MPAKPAAAPEGLESGVDFPIVCEVCLGPNPYIRMIKQSNHKECKVSGRVFNSFRWRPGSSARYKETVICPEVARAKGVCQCCLMDMEFNLPVGVREAMMNGGGAAESLPQSGVNQTYYYDQVAKASREDVEAGYGKMTSDKLLRMSRNSPYYDRNLPKLCSFWLKGACSRVVEGTCPFRPCCGTFRFPELASNHPSDMKVLIAALSKDGPVKVMRDKSEEMEAIKEKMKESQRGSRDQNIRNRYHGKDELTEKYLGKAQKMDLEAPEDQSITTLYIGLMGQNITEQDLTDKCYAYGEIKSVQIIPGANCAFLTYATRAEAEHAVEKLNGNLIVNGIRLKVLWGKAQKKAYGETDDAAAGIPGGVLPGGALPPGYVPPAPPRPHGAPPGGGSGPPNAGGMLMGGPPPMGGPPSHGMHGLPPGFRGPPPGMPPQGMGGFPAPPSRLPPPPGMGGLGPMPMYPSMDPNQMGTRPDRVPPPPPGRPPPKK